MNRYKFFILIIIGLLISNGVLLFMFINGPRIGKGPKDEIISKLHFDEGQIKNYEVYIQKHRNLINDNEDKMNELRSQLYQKLSYQQDNHQIDSLLSKIASQQYVAEKINYDHFLAIKGLCIPSQQNDFNKLTKEIANLFSVKERN